MTPNTKLALLILVLIMLAVLTSCGGVDTPRELYTPETTCRSLSGVCA